MAHLPELPSAAAHARVLLLLLSIMALAASIACCGARALSEAGPSALLLLFFQPGLLVLEGLGTLVHAYLHARERRDGACAFSPGHYYAALLPELATQLACFCHHVHVWWVHGLFSFSLFDVMLLANTKVQPHDEVVVAAAAGVE